MQLSRNSPFQIGVSTLLGYYSTIVFPIECTIKQVFYYSQGLATCEWLLGIRHSTLALRIRSTHMYVDSTDLQSVAVYPDKVVLVLPDFEVQTDV